MTQNGVEEDVEGWMHLMLVDELGAELEVVVVWLSMNCLEGVSE